MSLSRYLVGLLYFSGIWGSVALGTTVIARRRLGQLDGAAAVVGVATVGVVALVGVHLVPLALGILSRPSVLVTAALFALATWMLVRPGPTRAPQPPPAPPPSSRLSWAIAGAAVAAIAVCILAYLRKYATFPITGVDFVSFHLPGVARWIQTGTVWENIEYLPQFAVGNYPNTGDVLFLSAVLPWRGDAFIRFVNPPLVALVGLSVYAIARELRAPRAASALMAAVVISTWAVMVTALDRGKPETLMLAAFGAGVLFLLRHARTGERVDLVLAGLGLGLAVGTRWNGGLAVAVLLVAWVAAWAIRRAGRPPPWRDGLTLVGVITATGGFWLVRNLVVTGNPVFPYKVAPLGLTLFDAPVDEFRVKYGYSVADYLTNSSVLDHVILPGYRTALGLPGVLLTVGAILATPVALARRRRDGEAMQRRTAIVALAVVAAVIALVYVITPGSAQGLLDRPFPGIVREAVRWTMPSAVIAGALSAWLLGRVGRWALALELAAVAAVADGLRRSFDLPTSYVLEATAVVVGLAAIAAAIIALRRRRPLRAVIPARAAFIGVSALVGAGVAAGGYFSQRTFAEQRYRSSDHTNDWVVANAPAGHRVGLAGDFPGGVFVAPLFGPRFDNYVTYVGPTVRGMLQQYHSQEPFVSALRRKHLDLVIVGRGVPPRVTVECWTLSAGFVPIVRSERQVLLAKTVPPGMRRPPLPSCR